MASIEPVVMTVVPEKKEEIRVYTPVRSRRPSISGTPTPASPNLSLPISRLHKRSLSVEGTQAGFVQEAPDSPFRSGRYDQIGGVPQPLSWGKDSCSSLLQSHYGMESFSSTVDNGNGGGFGSISHGGESSFLARTEAVWTYYAKSATVTELSRKGLYRLSEDVLDEFIERYKAKLRKVHEDDPMYGATEVDRDLRADLPIMLPAKIKEGRKVVEHDDFVKYIMKYAMSKLCESPGQISRAGSRRPSVSLTRAPSMCALRGDSRETTAAVASPKATSTSQALISKQNFIRGWRSCQAEIFALINNADGTQASICAIM